MKTEIPAANAVIATIYLLMIIALGYLIKLIFKPPQTQSSTPPKYTSTNLQKSLTNPFIQNNVSVTRTLVQSYLMKYSIAGAFMNTNRCYLLKQIFIIAVVFVACTSINRITLWSLGLCVAFVTGNFVMMEIFRLPFVWNVSQKIDEEKKVNVDGSEQLEIEPGLIVNEHGQARSNKQVKVQQSIHSYRYTAFLAALSFASLVMVTQTMMTIYNSISNLGALNIGSVICVVLIDQVAIRPGLGGILFAAFKFIIYRSQSQLENAEGQAQTTANLLKIFEIGLFRNLCEEILLKRMNQIYKEHGQSSNYQMGASPTRKKTFSPSKIPKANPLVPESDTLMNLEQTKRKQLEHLSQEQKQESNENAEMEKSPIKQIDLANLRESFWLTSAEKQIFTQEIENNQIEINKPIDPQSAQKIKINPNQYFSVQRLPKDELNHEEHMQDDGLVLVQAGLNLVKEKDLKLKPNTIDIEFSPTKKRKKTMGAYPKRRQLIITGSSPYLEYLPDMMKKQRQNKKNMTPSSHNQIPTISRKVL